MIWVLLTVVAVLLVGVLAALLSGRIRYDPLSEPVSTQPDPGLGDSFTARSIADVQFDTALRGYRMAEVDDMLRRMAEELEHRDAALAEMRSQRPANL